MTDDHELVTIDHLDELGLTLAEVRRLPVIEYTALDGRPCWRRADLEQWLGRTE